MAPLFRIMGIAWLATIGGIIVLACLSSWLILGVDERAIDVPLSFLNLPMMLCVVPGILLLVAARLAR